MPLSSGVEAAVPEDVFEEAVLDVLVPDEPVDEDGDEDEDLPPEALPDDEPVLDDDVLPEFGLLLWAEPEDVVELPVDPDAEPDAAPVPEGAAVAGADEPGFSVTDVLSVADGASVLRSALEKSISSSLLNVQPSSISCSISCESISTVGCLLAESCICITRLFSCGLYLLK